MSIGFASGVMGSLQILGSLTAAVVGSFVQVLCVCVLCVCVCLYSLCVVCMCMCIRSVCVVYVIHTTHREKYAQHTHVYYNDCAIVYACSMQVCTLYVYA